MNYVFGKKENMDLANKNILIVGLGKSGVAVARFLKSRGASVIATDVADEQELGSTIPLLQEMDVRLEVGSHPGGIFETADLIIVSPGVPHTIEPLRRAASKGIPVIGEIELAYHFIKEPIVAVTGTNGKTTTTTLLGNMLADSGYKVFVGGNIGNPLIEYADKTEKADVVVAEVSSFQLDTIKSFRPNVGVLLNITEDHIDRYPDFDAYARAKARLFENQKKSDAAVINGSDSIVRSVCKDITARKLCYRQNDSHSEYQKDAWINGDRKVLYLSGSAEGGKNAKPDLEPVKISAPNIYGKHNLENACAAGLATLAAGGTIEGVQAALNRFKGLSHRLEYVTTIDGIEFINDSKATNVDSVARALDSFDKPVILIMGGRDKGGNFKLLSERIACNIKKLIVMGEAGEKIKSELGHIISAELVFSMEEAVFSAFNSGKPGDVVLLSPACASFDMYDSYAQRGEVFFRAVDHLSQR
jgi:UDP-N-acetylmuramoylalanine--D-glutamate ligase